MNPPTRAALAIAAACIVSCSRPEPEPKAPSPPVNLGARVTVLAADVLVVDGRHIRLSNVFGPEGVPSARCWAEALAAREAAREVRDFVTAARAIDVRPTGGRDEYNREFALVSLDGLDLGETLFERSLVAMPPKGRRFEWCRPISEPVEGAPDVRPLMNTD